MSKITIDDKRVFNIFNEVLPEKDPLSDLTYIESLLHKKRNSESEDFYVPVLGIQGTGKSSFLNALLMEDYILPVDADETTSVPVEIRYGKTDKIVVHFIDKPAVELKEPKEIEQYVHNNYNPGNEKQVKMVQVFKKHSLLKTGVVFVDLPGVGSLTESNVKTTMEYIEKLSAAIFMLRTVPPITKSEANFLRLVWPKLSKAWFIQNQWNDESLSEVEDGKQHNEYILEQIRNSHKMSDPIDIRVVNVYAALTGKLSKDQNLIQQSSIPAFIEFITTITSNWQSLLNDELESLEKQAVKDIDNVLTKKIELYNTKPEEHYEYLRKQEIVLQEKVDENFKILEDLKLKLMQEQINFKAWIHDELKNSKGNLRAKMRPLVRENIVDGARLTEAFNDHQKDILNDVFSEFLAKITELKTKIEATYQDLNIRTPDGKFDSFEKFDRKQALKIEKGLPKTLAFGSGVGVIILASNPLGWGALGIGLLVGGIADFVGKQAKKGVEKRRQRITIEELKQPIESFISNLEDKLTNDLTDFITNVNQTIIAVNQEQELMLEQAYEEQRDMRFVEIEDYQAKKTKLEEDLAYIRLLEVEL